jgi:hypothetical protein
VPINVFVWFLVYFTKKRFKTIVTGQNCKRPKTFFPSQVLRSSADSKSDFCQKKCHLSFWKRKKIFEKSVQHPIIPNDSRKIVSNGNRNITRQQLMDLIQIWIKTKKQKSTPPQIRSLKSKMFYFDMMFDLAQLLLFS